jgi:hypothetical protein
VYHTCTITMSFNHLSESSSSTPQSLSCPPTPPSFDAIIRTDTVQSTSKWWCRSEQRQRYPGLSHMAISILSIPAEASEPERTFSSARWSCSWDRSRLTCLNIGKIECIGSWLREGHIKPLSLNRMGLPMEQHLEDNTEAMDDDVGDLVEWI